MADLIENALIATHSHTLKGEVCVKLGKRKDIFCFAIFDNGIPFPKEVIQNLGKQRISTRTAIGGKGIGLMTTYNICQKYHASFLIEQPYSDGIYTKCVSILFDDQNTMSTVSAGCDSFPL